MTISHTAYAGEHGYAIFCRKKHVVEIRGQTLNGGTDMVIRPMQFSTLDRLRTVSCLLLFPDNNAKAICVKTAIRPVTAFGAGIEFIFVRKDQIYQHREPLRVERSQAVQDLRRQA